MARIGKALGAILAAGLVWPVSADAGLRGHWPLDEPGGAIALDASGSAGVGEIQGGPTRVAGAFGGALELAPGDRVVVPASPALEPAPHWTLAAWLRPRALATQHVIAKSRFDAVDGYELSLSSSGLPFVRLHQASAGNGYKLFSTSPYPTDGVTWIHLAASFDGAALRLYVDGALEAQLDAPELPPVRNDEPLVLGTPLDSPFGYEGAIDDVQLFDRALSPADVASLVATGAPLPDRDGDGVPDAQDAFPDDPNESRDSDGDGSGDVADPDDDGDGLPDAWELASGLDPLDPADAAADPDGDGHSSAEEFARGTDPLRREPSAVGLWSLDVLEDGIVADGSAHANHGALRDAAGVLSESGALHFAGEGGRVEVPHHPSLDLSEQLTVAAWVRPERIATQDLVRKGRFDGADGFELSLSSSGAAFVRFNQPSAGNDFKLLSERPYPNGGGWLHLAATFDGREIRLYLDGTLDAALPAEGLVIGTNDAPLVMGADPDGLRALLGTLDDVRLYDRAATPGEVANLMAFGSLFPDRDGDGFADDRDVFPDDPAEWSDHDGDGTGDNADPDDDADGLPDAWEASHGLDPLDPADADLDSDGDGLSNRAEHLAGSHPFDRDNDGAPDAEDAFPDDPTETRDSDGDGTGDVADPDDDGDGLPDEWELAFGFDPLDPADAAADPDGDGLSGVAELARGTHPRLADSDADGTGDAGDAFPLDPSEQRDTDADGEGDNADPDDDGDGIPDDWERAFGFDPLDPADAAADPDGDGRSNLAEHLAGSHPFDRDNDGAPDAEDAFPDDPTEQRDTDADGEGDVADPDDDGDGLPDDWETQHGLDPLDPADAGLDPDGDGLASRDELPRGTDPRRADSDGDGAPDAEDAFPVDPAEQRDSDGDGQGDHADPDDDGDGLPDDWEALYGLDPLDPTDAALDPDGDGLASRDELPRGTDPRRADSDGDGALDAEDAFPLDPAEQRDSDADGEGDHADPDDDGDGIPDDWEALHDFDPLDPDDAGLDPDGDGLANRGEYTRGSHPRLSDSDGDGAGDADDAFPLDPSEQLDSDADGEGDRGDPDDDGDGMTDDWELFYGFDPLDAADAHGDPDEDGTANVDEFLDGTNPYAPPERPAVGRWSFEEGDGDVAVDGSGSLNHGELRGSPRRVAGAFGEALELDGSDEWVQVPHHGSLDLLDAFTLAAWIRPESSDTQYLIKKARHGDVDGYELSLSSSGRVFVRVNEESDGNDYKLLSERRYPDDGETWLFAAATFDGHTLRLYLDARLDGALPAPGLSVRRNEVPLSIGAQHDGVGAFRGAIDEVWVLPRALGAAELALLMDTGEAPSDRDGDGVPTPGDAFPDDSTEWLDTDGDGVGDRSDADDDGDAMPDDWERLHGFDPLDPSDAEADADGDGIANRDEFMAGTDPGDGSVQRPGDADGDAMPDAWERIFGLDPSEASDAALDADGDGVSNRDEFHAGTNPRVSALPVAHWPLDEGLGSTAFDASGEGHPGSLVGGPEWMPERFGSSLRFAGDGARVQVPDAPRLDAGAELAVAAWVRPGDGGGGVVVAKAQRDAVDGYELGISSSGRAFARLRQASSGNALRVTSAKPLSDDGSTWSHLAASYDGQELRLYVDGALEDALLAPGLSVPDNALPLSIGAEHDGARAFAGRVDDVQLYDRALAPDEVAGTLAEGAFLLDGNPRVRVGDVRPAVETEPVRSDGDAADDPAIWVHPQDPSESRVIGTDKQRGLSVYDLDGRELQFLADGDINNVDVRYGFPLAGGEIDLVAASNRSDDSIALYRVDPASGLLENVAAGGTLETGIDAIYGFCLYASRASGRFYAFITSERGAVEQWELFAVGGAISGSRVRRFEVGSQSEGCVADDEHGVLYVGEEDVGIWRYGAEPEAGSSRTLVDGVGGALRADVEGLALYTASDGTGYLIASSQGDDRYVVYRREGDNARVGTFPIVGGHGIDGTQETDGLDVTSAPLGPLFPAGLLVVQDDSNGSKNQNFKLVPWERVADAFERPLLVDPSVDPRAR